MKVRDAHRSDWPAVEALVAKAGYSSPVLWRWRAFLKDASLILVEETSRIQGVLFASSDDSPVAWVRLAATREEVCIDKWLDLSLPKLLEDLQARAVRELAWMDDDERIVPHLVGWGFRSLTEIITLTKTGRDPDILPVRSSDLALRPARDEDFETMEAIDRAAFAPHWWRSTATLRRRAATTSAFTVAVRDGRIVGYVEWESHLSAAHINRVTVHPKEQGQGAGTLLVTHALEAIWGSGVERVSLNTQSHNRRARRLYEHLGFTPTGDDVPVWTLYVQQAREGW